MNGNGCTNATPAELVVAIGNTKAPFIWSEGWENILLAPFNYLRTAEGSGFRTEMIAAFNKMLCVPEDKCRIITSVIDCLQTVSLLYDDVQDSSKLRRGIPTAHQVFGVAQVVNTGQYAYLLALEMAQRFLHPDSMIALIQKSMNMCRGQGMELHWRETFACPSEEEYVMSARGKTGGLLRLVIQLMENESPMERDHSLIPFVDIVGVIYQLVNDHRGLHDPDFIRTKGNIDDVAEGKFTLPLIHCLKGNSSASRGGYPSSIIANILHQRPENTDVQMIALECIKDPYSLHYTENIVRELLMVAKSRLANLKCPAAAKKDIQSILDKLEWKAFHDV